MTETHSTPLTDDQSKASAAPVEAAWQAILQRSQPVDREAIAPLRVWLGIQVNPHAALLSSQPTSGPADDQSARELEALIVARYVNREITLTTVAQHLVLLHRVGKQLRKRGTQLAPTWITSILRPHPSPFPANTSIAVVKVDRWRESLSDLIVAGLDSLSPKEIWPIALLSSVLHGALLDRAKLIRLRAMLARHGRPVLLGQSADDHSYVEFLMPYSGFGNHHLQRWYLDPATELLLGRLPQSPDLPTFQESYALAIEALLRGGLNTSMLPTSITDLLQCAKVWWATRAAPVDLHAMQRTFAAHSLTKLCWTRITGTRLAAEVGAMVGVGRGAPRVSPSAQTEAELFNAAAAEHEWLPEVQAMLNCGKLPIASDSLNRYFDSIEDDDYRKPYVGWLRHALVAPPRNAKIGAKLLVLSLPFLLAAPRLLNYLGERQPQSLDTAELDETYRTILDGCDPHEPVERIARGLRLFHDYLVKYHHRAALPNPRETFGEGGSLMPVDATVVSPGEYLAALDWLDKQIETGADVDDRTVCRLVLVLAFRAGLRRREIFGLRLCDVHDCGSLTLLVRPYWGHRLKTPSATRTVPIGALLSVRERQWLRAWLSRRAAEESSRRARGAPSGSPLLLARPGGMDAVSIDGVVRRTMHALRAVTHESRLHLHHLRHSCASWLWLKLRAPDYPEVQELLTSMPVLQAELKTARRVRVLLCGAAHGPSRSYTYVVAKILGHSSPATSLAHYLHVADLFQAATVLRTAATMRIEIWQSLTGASRSTAYEWLSRGAHGVVVGHRARPNTPLSERDAGDPQPPTENALSSAEQGGWHKLVSKPQLRFDGEGSIACVNRVLHLYNGLPPDLEHEQRLTAISERCGRLVPVVAEWIRRAHELAGAFDIQPSEEPHGTGVPTAVLKVPAPDVNIQVAEVTAMQYLSRRLEDAERQSSALVRNALALVPLRFNRRRNDVVFRGAKDEIASRLFIKMLDIAGLTPSLIQLVVRRVDKDDLHLPSWFRTPRAAGLRIKREPPPGIAIKQTKAYARWVGMRLCDEAGKSQGAAWRRVLFLACVAFGTDAPR